MNSRDERRIHEHLQKTKAKDNPTSSNILVEALQNASYCAVGSY
jgi:hypothetical protein